MSREALYDTLRRLEIDGTIHIECASEDVADDVLTEIANADPDMIPDLVHGLVSTLCTHDICVCDGENDIVTAART